MESIIEVWEKNKEAYIERYKREYRRNLKLQISDNGNLLEMSWVLISIFGLSSKEISELENEIIQSVELPSERTTDRHVVDLINRAIESANCRIYRLRERKYNSGLQQQVAENQKELMDVTVKALKYYKNNVALADIGDFTMLDLEKVEKALRQRDAYVLSSIAGKGEHVGRLKSISLDAENSLIINVDIDEQSCTGHLVTWKDIVEINGINYAEEFPISGKMDNEDTYQIDDFLVAVAKKYGVGVESVKTYSMDNIEFCPIGLPFGAEECGCYINGIAEWLIREK